MPRRPKLVLVKWVDISSDPAWQQRQDVLAAADEPLFQSVGWLIQRPTKTKPLIMVGTLSLSRDDLVGETIRIPKGVIREIIEIPYRSKCRNKGDACP